MSLLYQVLPHSGQRYQGQECGRLASGAFSASPPASVAAHRAHICRQARARHAAEH
ncbi:hypothetical protein ACLMNJ_37425 [Streptomyces seoulensis]